MDSNYQFKCDDCEQFFDHVHLLLQHQRFRHGNFIYVNNFEAQVAKCYCCPLRNCNYSFRSLGDLSNHLRQCPNPTMTTEPVCTNCLKTLSSKSSFIKHLLNCLTQT